MLNKEIIAALAGPKIQAHIAHVGTAVLAGSPANAALSMPKKP
jgi:hypothetical protein